MLKVFRPKCSGSIKLLTRRFLLCASSHSPYTYYLWPGFGWRKKIHLPIAMRSVMLLQYALFAESISLIVVLSGTALTTNTFCPLARPIRLMYLLRDSICCGSLKGFAVWRVPIYLLPLFFLHLLLLPLQQNALDVAPTQRYIGWGIPSRWISTINQIEFNRCDKERFSSLLIRPSICVWIQIYHNRNEIKISAHYRFVYFLFDFGPHVRHANIHSFRSEWFRMRFVLVLFLFWRNEWWPVSVNSCLFCLFISNQTESGNPLGANKSAKVCSRSAICWKRWETVTI